MNPFLNLDKEPVDPRLIIKATARVANEEEGNITGYSRKPEHFYPRAIAMMLVKEMSGLSLKTIGSYFSNRDHSTVLSSIRRAEALCKKKPKAETLRQLIVSTLLQSESLQETTSDPESSPSQ